MPRAVRASRRAASRMDPTRPARAARRLRGRRGLSAPLRSEAAVLNRPLLLHIIINAGAACVVR